MSKHKEKPAAPPVELSDWRGKALEFFPDLTEIIENEDTDNPYMLWIELRQAFEKAYVYPRNEDLIRRIYAYSKWCMDQPRQQFAGDDLFTCVAVCFLEHIPEDPAARADMPRWFTRHEVLGSEQIFRYMIDEKEWLEILALYDIPAKHSSKKKRLR